MANLDVPLATVQSFMKKEEETDYLTCSDIVMAHFLDGLIYFKRGKDESRPALPLELPVSNNMILKKLRVTFELREDDIHSILKELDFQVGRAELTGILRKKGHRNYRDCGDQILRYFLKGLSLRFRGPN